MPVRTPILVLALLLLAPSARAAVTLTSYELDVSLYGDEPARYRLLLEYRSVGELKPEGSRHLGWQRPSDVSVVDADGLPLQFALSQEERSKELRLDFQLPRPDEKGRRRVRIELAQPLHQRHGLRSRLVTVPWADSGVNVPEMRVLVSMPGLEALPGFDCSDRDLGCQRAGGARAVVLELPPSTAGGGAALLALAACAGALALHFRGRLRQRLRKHGVVPSSPAAVAGGADPSQQTPLPASEEPVLPPAERRAFFMEVALRTGLVLSLPLFVGLLLLVPLSPLPAPWVLAAALVFSTAVLLLTTWLGAAALGLAALPLGASALAYLPKAQGALVVFVSLVLVFKLIAHRSRWAGGGFGHHVGWDGDDGGGDGDGDGGDD